MPVRFTQFLGNLQWVIITSTDSATINAIINGAGSNSLFYFPPGTYTANQDITFNGLTNIAIIGAGRASIIRAGAGSIANCLKISNCTHVVIRDLAIDGNKANVSQQFPIGSQYTHLNGIWITGCDDVTAETLYVHDHYAGGILADSSTNLIMSKIRVANGYDNGIFLRPSVGNVACQNVIMSNIIASGMAFSGIQAIRSSFLTFANCISFSNGPTVGQGDGIGIEGCDHVTIGSNVCYNNGIQGINVRYTNEGGPNLACSHVAVIANVCTGHTSTDGDAGGILISAVDDITVLGNLSFGNYFGVNLTDTNGLSVTNAYFGDNIIRGNSNIGLRIGSTAHTTMLLANNFVADNASHNIYTISPIIVKGGIYKGATGAGHNGIYLDTGSDGSVIDGASLFDNADNGILVNAGANDIIRNCHFPNPGAIQGRALYEVGGAGPTTMWNNLIAPQQNQPYFFNNAASRYYDAQTVGSATVTTNTTVGANDEVILCNQAGAITVTLPTAVNAQGRLITVKDKSGTGAANNITIATTGGQTIDGTATKVINTNYGALRLVSDGANWFIL